MSGVETSVKISRDTTVYDSRNSSVSKFLMSLKIFHESQIFSWVSNFFHESQKFFMSLKNFFMSLTKPPNGPYVSHCFEASCKDLHWKTDFSLPFYAESWKMRKIPFLVTKSGQILNLMSGKVPRPQICGGFHLSESSSDGRNIPLEGGQKRPFLPPPAWLVSIWRTLSQNEA